ncbi:GFA family protein [Kushneria phosphatilytica]|uniref:GFA family protein n=1 Tax=Kushneria phosphatilytica TaxID=657387 RepID=A0A1S1NZF2_9GAMM|nr:GFA family protein [Kushneria phosphatilytica]OHV13896.1 aldehyde-activating protein [Kushneria phosphatilytica]QEL10456.1 GFA family protein [Kushneria phosphatilytica]
MNQDKLYQGSCFCGAVRIRLTSDPVVMGYCHCESCRHWSAGPVNAFTLWKPESLQVVEGDDHIGSFNKTPQSIRKWCKSCGGHLFTEHPEWGLVDVYAAVIDDFAFQPSVHVHYQETVLPIRDGLPKMQDVPAEMGGSGVTLNE